jgi:ABC-type multidrug transport system ATPase subunit
VLTIRLSSVSKIEKLRRIQTLISAFGLQAQADTLVGTPIRKGIGGGQKRRLSVASHLVTSPKVLFLDEVSQRMRDWFVCRQQSRKLMPKQPTSGLDSQAAFEVISFVKRIAKAHNVCTLSVTPLSPLTPPDSRHCQHPPAFDRHL